MRGGIKVEICWIEKHVIPLLHKVKKYDLEFPDRDNYKAVLMKEFEKILDTYDGKIVFVRFFV